MSYIDGYLLAVPKKKIKDYKAMARYSEKVWRKHGALDYKECVGDDLTTKTWIPFTRVMKTRPGETVVFSFIVFKSRAHRDRVNAAVMKEMGEMEHPANMPFDEKRIVYGGFEALAGFK